MDEARYRIALKVAKAGLRRLGRSSVDGKDAHDLAMQSLHIEPWFKRIVWFDVIDAYRRERGRTRRRRMVALPHGAAAPDVERFELQLKIANGRQRLICELLAAGYLKQEVAAVVGVTPARIGQIIAEIRRSNAEPVQGAGGSGGGTEEPAG